jgi:hypothetical protein
MLMRAPVAFTITSNTVSVEVKAQPSQLELFLRFDRDRVRAGQSVRFTAVIRPEYQNEKQVGKIEFNIDISLTLKGIILKIRDGRIKEILTGSCKGKGTVRYGNLVITEKETGSFTLPGSIDLGDGIPIAP